MSSRTVRWCAVLVLLLCCAAALVYQAWRLSLTADEPSHFAAGYMYWLGEDLLHPSDTPPLMRIISGWIPRLMAAPPDRSTGAWRAQDAYGIGTQMLGSLDAVRARKLLFFTRLPFVAFPLLIVWMLWHWGRQLFGDATALVLAACGALEPTILGHGALIKSDVPAAFAALWFAYGAWRYWHGPSRRALLLMTAALVVAVLTKFTLLPLAMVAWVLAMAKGPRIAGAILIPLAVYVGILAAYQFQAGPVPQAEIDQFVPAGIPSGLLPLARMLARIPWPLQFVRGLLFIGGSLHGPGFTGYMLRQRLTGWVPAYFPLAWVVKFPIPLQALTLAGLAAFAVRVRRRQVTSAELFIWGSAAFYFGSAVLSNFHIGFRHVLPALPFFILGGGYALRPVRALTVPARTALQGRDRKRAAGTLIVALALVWLAVSSLRVYPDGLSYFNEWIGGPHNGWKYLADSNVDWGQDFAALADYAARRPVPHIKTFLFGLDNPAHYLKPRTWDDQPYPWSSDSPLPPRLRPHPGVYAVSVNLQLGFLAPPNYADYLVCFRGRPADDRAGYSILIYVVK